LCDQALKINFGNQDLSAFEFLIAFGALDIAVAAVFPIVVAVGLETVPCGNISYSYHDECDSEKEYANNQVHSRKINENATVLRFSTIRAGKCLVNYS
jgi:hypothetical protein